MKPSLLTFPRIALVIAVTAGAAAHAATNTLNQPLSVSTSTTYNGASVGSNGADDLFTFQVEPFDSSLGDLVSFTFTWEASGDFNGTAASAGSYVEAYFGGTFAYNGAGFDGIGSAPGSASGTAGATLAGSYALAPHVWTRLASDAGVSYSPDLLATVTGDAAYTLTARNGVKSFAQIECSGVAGLVSNVQGKVTVTYTYTPKAAQPATGLKVNQITRDAAANTLTLGWSSQTGMTYSVDVSDNLTDWQVLSYGIAAAPPSNVLTESDLPADASHRFYRVRSRQ